MMKIRNVFNNYVKYKKQSSNQLIIFSNQSISVWNLWRICTTLLFLSCSAICVNAAFLSCFFWKVFSMTVSSSRLHVGTASSNVLLFSRWTSELARLLISELSVSVLSCENSKFFLRIHVSPTLEAMILSSPRQRFTYFVTTTTATKSTLATQQLYDHFITGTPSLPNRRQVNIQTLNKTDFSNSRNGGVGGGSASSFSA